MTRAVLFVNGNVSKLDFVKTLLDGDTYIIGCDGGADKIFELGYKPNAMIGDFDSVKNIPDEIINLKPKKAGTKKIIDEITYIKYPADKDFLDTELAIDFAVVKGFEEIILVNVLGDESDHVLGTIFLLGLKKYSDKNIKIIQQNQELFIVSGEVEINGKSGQKISLIPIFGKVKVRSSSGLKYDPSKYKMTMQANFGISNEFVGSNIKLDIAYGKFLAVSSYATAG